MLTLALLSGLALADIAPPPDFVETCTVANHVKPGEECTMCGAWHGGREDCEALEAQGYSARCRTSGASTWDEVMCRAAATPEVQPADGPPSADTIPEVPAEPATPTAPAAPAGAEARCASAAPAGLWALLLATGLLALRRRR